MTRGLQGVTMQIMRAVLVAAFAVVSALVAPAGCSTSSAGVQCQPGQMLACSCYGALNSTTQCDSNGHPLACSCPSGSGSGSSGSGGGDAATDGAGVGDAGGAG